MVIRRTLSSHFCPLSYLPFSLWNKSDRTIKVKLFFSCCLLSKNHPRLRISFKVYPPPSLSPPSILPLSTPGLFSSTHCRPGGHPPPRVHEASQALISSPVRWWLFQSSFFPPVPPVVLDLFYSDTSMREQQTDGVYVGPAPVLRGHFSCKNQGGASSLRLCAPLTRIPSVLLSPEHVTQLLAPSRARLSLWRFLPFPTKSSCLVSTLTPSLPTFQKGKQSPLFFQKKNCFTPTVVANSRLEFWETFFFKFLCLLSITLFVVLESSKRLKQNRVFHYLNDNLSEEDFLNYYFN